MQQQPGTVTHSHISSLLISRRLTRPRVASSLDFYVTESGRGNEKFSGVLRAQVAKRPVAEPLF